VEQRLVFGEIAEQYDQARPSYPDALFDTIIEHGGLMPGDPALEIGAGTGKATRGFLARGIAVHALEPSAGMAAVLRGHGVAVEDTTFEEWEPQQATAFRLVYAAQAWHWVHSADRYEKVASVLAPGGTLALFWNQGRPLEGDLRVDNDAAYDEHAPNLTGSGHWRLDRTLDEMSASAGLRDATKRVVTWEQRYTTAEWLTLLGTHSDHRILPEAQRTRLHAAVGEVIDKHGGYLDVVYDTWLYLATRA
jgi:SAM-dependent methyltransferase